MPSDVTPDDIAEAYRWGWELGLKALAIYRDGSKQSQPLSTSTEGDKEAAKAVGKPRRERLPDTRQSMTHKFSVAGHEGYVTVGLYKDGRPGELFITMAKEGSTVGGLMDSFGTAISICLQYGVPLQVLVNKFSHTRFEPMGHTSNPDVRIAKSLVDYIFRWLDITFQSSNGSGVYPVPEANAEPKTNGKTNTEAMPSTNGAARNGSANGHINGEATKAIAKAEAELKLAEGDSGQGEQFARFQSDAPSCDNCGSITVRNGNCYLCHNCGNSMGCS
jgi:ribonucleoside-diphosphate reductase alpha chain